MVSVLRLLTRSVFAYDLKSVAYKPIPSSNGTSVAAPSANSTAVQAGSAVVNQAVVALQEASKTHGKSAKPSGSCDVQPYDAPPISDQDFPPFDQTTANVFRYRQQQSVNMGSWFVHENWMTPSVFSCAAGAKTAEIDIANGWGAPKNAQAVLERHWDTFITAADFHYLAGIGINTVRLPIGYWSLGPDHMGGTPFAGVAGVYANSWARVVRAINQAGQAGLGVLVDLHGAVGSQNGQPHSGVSDGQTNMFSVPANVEKTIAVLTFLAEQLSTVNNVVGIQVLNEPKATDALQDFYTRAIDAMRSSTPAAKDMPLYVHDGFDLEGFSSFVANRTDFVVQDHHSYFVFSPSDKKESGAQHTADVQSSISQALAAVSEKQHRNLVVDEWSCALTPESIAGENNVDQVRKEFCSEQMKVYSNATAGWSFWSYKKEDCASDPGWCFTAAVGNSLPSTFFAYGQSAQKSNQRASNASDSLIMPTVSTSLLNLMNAHSETTANQERAAGRPHLAHRFASIHARRDGDAASGAGDKNASATKGYTDGLTTAKVFAGYNMSKLGFAGQFMQDAVRAAGPTLIAAGTEDGYHGGFMKGLREGETQAVA